MSRALLFASALALAANGPAADPDPLPVPKAATKKVQQEWARVGAEVYWFDPSARQIEGLSKAPKAGWEFGFHFNDTTNLGVALELNLPDAGVPFGIYFRKPVSADYVSSLSRFKNLRALELAGDDAVVVAAAALPQVERLWLRGNPMYDYTTKTTSGAITAKGAKALTGMKGLNRLEIGYGVEGAALAECAKIPGLKSFACHPSALWDDTFEAFAKSSNVERIEFVRPPEGGGGSGIVWGLSGLGNAPPSHATGLKAVARIKSLRVLIVRGAVLDGRSLDALAGATQLTELRLGGCVAGAPQPFVGAAVPLDKPIYALAKLKNLKVLDLSLTALTNDGLKELEALTELTLLDVRKTNVTQKGVDSFKAAVPKCKVLWN